MYQNTKELSLILQLDYIENKHIKKRYTAIAMCADYKV